MDDHWQDSYHGFYSGMEPCEYLSLTMGPQVPSLVHNPITTEFLHESHVGDPAQNATYLSPGHVSAAQRQQQAGCLHIDTQVSPYRINDSDSSTSSISPFHTTPQPFYYQPYLDMHPSIHNSSPQSTSGESGSGMLMPEPDKFSSLPTSPLSPYSPSFEGSTGMPGDHVSPRVPVDTNIVTRVQMAHIIEWKRVMEECGTNDFVPQTVYQPYTEADRKRYIRDVKLQETIFFHSDDSSELGISLDDALRQRLRRLKHKDDKMFVGCGPSVSIRIQWPGYTPWSKQIPTMDFKTPKGPITRAKLAKNIAACVRHFAEEVQDKPMEAESDIKWKIGIRHIRVEDLILVSLHHVSKGSWQPQLRLRKPIPAFSYGSPRDEPFSPGFPLPHGYD